MRWPLAVVLALALAGCNDGPGLVAEPARFGDVGLADLGPGFYAFRHPGGALSFGIAPGGQADLQLFDAADQRVGAFHLGNGTDTISIRSLAAGRPVLQVVSLEGELTVQGAAAILAFTPLAGHIERHVVASAFNPSLLPPSLGLAPAPTERYEANLTLDRVPTSLRLLLAGHAEDVHGVIRSAAGPVLDASGASFDILPALSLVGLDTRSVAELPGEMFRENFSGRLSGTIEAAGLDGAIVLEATSYSRAEPFGAEAVIANAVFPSFSYGEVTGHPVRLDVAAAAHGLLIVRGEPAEDNGTAALALFDGEGVRIATVQLTAGQVVAVHVPRTVIAAPLWGTVELGATAAPADFELHVLEVLETQVANPPPAGTYGQSNVTAEPEEGILWSFGSAAVRSDPLVGLGVSCDLDPFFRVMQGNETLAAGEVGLDLANAGYRLGDVPVTIQVQSFSSGACFGLSLFSFLLE